MRIMLQEEAEWNELLEGGAAEEGITPADREGASDPASLGAAAAEGAADGEPVADGELHHVTRAAASSGAENPGALYACLHVHVLGFLIH